MREKWDHKGSLQADSGNKKRLFRKDDIYVKFQRQVGVYQAKKGKEFPKEKIAHAKTEATKTWHVQRTINRQAWLEFRVH